MAASFLKLKFFVKSKFEITIKKQFVYSNKREFRSLKKILNGLCSNKSYTTAQCLEHRWPQAKVPDPSPGSYSQKYASDFPMCIPCTV